MIKVRNLKDTANEIPSGYGSWIAYWESQKGEATYCHRVGCSTTVDLEGAHVQKVSMHDRSWYIVPLCHTCNEHTDAFDVDINELVVVNPE
ncbi:MAG: hypothetical protein LBN93_09115 [Candidatus Symbiothrix sp.]|nr:hypothetical protein [Candidatus Symbiothrix sp.]